METNEKLEMTNELLKIANAKISAYKRAILGESSGKTGPDTGSSAISADDRDFVATLVKKTINEGSTFWKQVSSS